MGHMATGEGKFELGEGVVAQWSSLREEEEERLVGDLIGWKPFTGVCATVEAGFSFSDELLFSFALGDTFCEQSRLGSDDVIFFSDVNALSLVASIDDVFLGVVFATDFFDALSVFVAVFEEVLLVCGLG